MALMRVIELADELPADLDELIGETLDWFDGDASLSTEDFIDRLCTDYLNGRGLELESYDNPAARKIMRRARELRRERG